MSDTWGGIDHTAVKVVIAHQRRDIGSCICGWGVGTGDLGHSHSLHVWRQLQEAGVTAGRTAVIDPADVKVGDVVEVEAADGSWLVRGKVLGIYPQHADEYRIFLLDLDGHQAPVATKHATVRLVHRAEPEPDPAPEEIEALAAALEQCAMETKVTDGWAVWARELARHGVTVRKDGAS